MADANTVETLDHDKPLRPASTQLRPVFVAAFPESRALAIPNGDLVLNRRYLREQGITDGEISSQHALVTRKGGRVVVKDVGSRNGTFVDGQALAGDEERELEDGSILRLGRTLLVLRKAFDGPLDPYPPFGRYAAPWGLRTMRVFVDGILRSQARNILIEGETGTGKELVAEAVAEALGRGGRYAAVNVSGFPKGVFEAQLFGHVAGAFSDARTAAPGVIRAHDGGAVFLDEIGELPLELQPKLLRLLENREVVPVGASAPVTVDVLLLAATNQPLDERVQGGTFRRDLLARFLSSRLEVPRLADRPEDLFAVAAALASADPARGGLEADGVEVEALERLMLERWPDNARGLDAILRRAAALDPAPGLRSWTVERLLGPLEPASPEELSEEQVARVLEAVGGNEREAARRLGVSRGKLRRFRGK